jgi:hypothetical protein
MEEDGGGRIGDSSSSSSSSSSLEGEVLETEQVDLDHIAIQKKVEAIDKEYLELHVQEESLRGILEKLQKDQSCLEAGVKQILGEPGTKSNPINKYKEQANIDNEDDDEEGALQRLRQALMDESTCNGSDDEDDDDDEREATAGLGGACSMEV